MPDRPNADHNGIDSESAYDIRNVFLEGVESA